MKQWDCIFVNRYFAVDVVAFAGSSLCRMDIEQQVLLFASAYSAIRDKTNTWKSEEVLWISHLFIAIVSEVIPHTIPLSWRFFATNAVD